jgi:hypothetical protein
MCICVYWYICIYYVNGLGVIGSVPAPISFSFSFLPFSLGRDSPTSSRARSPPSCAPPPPAAGDSRRRPSDRHRRRVPQPCGASSRAQPSPLYPQLRLRPAPPAEACPAAPESGLRRRDVRDSADSDHVYLRLAPISPPLCSVVALAAGRRRAGVRRPWWPSTLPGLLPPAAAPDFPPIPASAESGRAEIRRRRRRTSPITVLTPR